jgi:hypothetical protein
MLFRKISSTLSQPSKVPAGSNEISGTKIECSGSTDWICSETLALTRINRNRTKLGVCEKVLLWSESGKSYTWSIDQGDGELDIDFVSTVTFMAPKTKDVCIICVDDTDIKPITFTIVEPNGVKMMCVAPYHRTNTELFHTMDYQMDNKFTKVVFNINKGITGVYSEGDEINEAEEIILELNKVNHYINLKEKHAFKLILEESNDDDDEASFRNCKLSIFELEPSGGFRAQIYILPQDVSFENIEIKEGEGVTEVTGCYQSEKDKKHIPAGVWSIVEPVAPNPGHIENKLPATSDDRVRMHAPDNWEIGQKGTFTWHIPWFYRKIGDDDQKECFTYVKQKAELHEDGEMTVSKGGLEKSFPLNSPETDIG